LKIIIKNYENIIQIHGLAYRKGLADICFFDYIDPCLTGHDFWADRIMKTVKRYDIMDHSGMEESPDGPWVDYEDYQALEKKLEVTNDDLNNALELQEEFNDLEQENQKLKEGIEKALDNIYPKMILKQLLTKEKS